MDSIGSNPRLGNLDLGAVRAQRQVNREVTVGEAADNMRARVLSPDEIAAHTALHAQALEGIDRLRGGFPGSSLPDIFNPPPEDKAVREATDPLESDNAQAEQIKREYRSSFNEARRERALASRQARQLGEGVHEMFNGDTVEVKTDRETGKTTVTTRRPDGSSKTVTFDKGDPSAVDVQSRDAHGREHSLSQRGEQIVRRDPNPFDGHIVERRYDLDDNGRPVRETRGPGLDDYERVRVGPDGSTETRRQTGVDADGNPIYDDIYESHKPWNLPVNPGPRPFPIVPGPFPHPIDPGPSPHPHPITPGPFPLPFPIGPTPIAPPFNDGRLKGQ